LTVGQSKDWQSVETNFFKGEQVCVADFNEESSFKGHTVNALVLTGDEGRDKLR
jgi:hypothetical protein